jgi:hypothetical protein
MSTPGEPLPPDSVDALLSAELDNELDSAAGELGLSASEARARLASTPGVDARRTALARARDLIATRPPLETPTAETLVAAALAGDELARARLRRDRQRRQWRVLAITGSAAAAIALIIVAGVNARTGSDASKSAASSPTAETAGGKAAGPAHPQLQPAPASPPLDFGDVTNSQALRNPARKALSNLYDKATQSTKAAQTPTAADANQASGGTPTTKVFVSSRCTGAPARYDAPAGAPLLVATGRVSGQPVEILVFVDAGKAVAYVISQTNCSLLATVPLG